MTLSPPGYFDLAEVAETAEGQETPETGQTDTGDTETSPLETQGLETDTSEEGRPQPEPKIREPVAPRPSTLPLKKAFVRLLFGKGFSGDEDGKQFRHPDGRVVIQAGSVFHWLEYLNGDTNKRYWIGRGSLEKGVEIPAEIWDWDATEKDQVVIVLIDEKNQANLNSSLDLKNLVREGHLNLFVPAYRLCKA